MIKPYYPHTVQELKDILSKPPSESGYVINCNEQVVSNYLDYGLFTYAKTDSVYIDIGYIPSIEVRSQHSRYSASYNEKLKKWPYALAGLQDADSQDLVVKVVDTRNHNIPWRSCFIIRSGYAYDGATILRLFWRLIGPPGDPHFIVGALLHDVVCQYHGLLYSDRRLSSHLLYACLRANKTPLLKSLLMRELVDLFQRFRHWHKVQ